MTAVGEVGEMMVGSDDLEEVGCFDVEDRG